MKTLALIQNIQENLMNERWSEAVDDISLWDRPRGYLRRIRQSLISDDGVDYYPDSAESERWIKSVSPMLVGEYACNKV